MVEINDRRLPVGIQSFEKIREGGYLYVDKTDIIWQLANREKTYNYLSRPRRFGKSVLVDTLEAYFLGKKELFEGLKIMQMETEWVKRPVIRLDMSRAGAAPESVRSYLDNAFHQLESEYDIAVRQNSSLADRFDAIIQTAYNKTGLQVAILIDEYDSPLQHSWKTPQHEACTAVYREVFAILKAARRLHFLTAQCLPLLKAASLLEPNESVEALEKLMDMIQQDVHNSQRTFMQQRAYQQSIFHEPKGIRLKPQVSLFKL